MAHWDSAGDLDAHGSILLSGETLRTTGNVRARQHLRLDGATRVTNEGRLSAPHISFPGAGPLYNINGGTLIADPHGIPKIDLPKGGMNNDGGKFHWKGDLVWETAFLYLGNGLFEVTGLLNLVLLGDFENSGTLLTGGPMKFTVGGNWTNSGKITAGIGGLEVDAKGMLSNLTGGSLAFMGPVELTSGSDMTQTGSLRSRRWVALQSKGGLLWGGETLAQEALGVSAVKNINMMGGRAVSLEEILINGDSHIQVDGELLSDLRLVINATGGLGQAEGGKLASKTTIEVKIGSGDSFLNGGRHAGDNVIFTSLGMVTIGAKGNWTVDGTLESYTKGQWTSGGQMRVANEVTLGSEAGIRQESSGLLASKEKIEITSRSGNVVLNGAVKSGSDLFIGAENGSIGQASSGLMEVEGDLVAQAPGNLILGGINHVTGLVSLVSGQDMAVGGEMVAQKLIEAQAGGNFLNFGKMISGGNLVVSSKGHFDQNGFGEFYSERDITLRSDGNLFLGGSVEALGVIDGLAASSFSISGTTIGQKGVTFQSLIGGEIWGKIVSGADVALKTLGQILLVGSNSKVEAKGNIVVEAVSGIGSQGGVSTEKSLQLFSERGAIAISGTTYVGGDASLTAAGAIGHSGSMRVGGNTQWIGSNIAQVGYLGVDKDLKLDGIYGIATAGWTGAAGVVDLRGLSYTNRGFVGSETGLSIIAPGGIENRGTLASTRSAEFYVAQGGLVNSGAILIKDSLKGEFSGGLDQQGGTLAAGHDLNLKFGSGVLNRLGLISADHDLSLILPTDSGQWIRNEGGNIYAGHDGLLRAAGMANVTSGGLAIENGIVQEHGFDRYMITYPNVGEIGKIKIKSYDVLFREAAVMGYSAKRAYAGSGSMLSAGNNLTVDVKSGSNEASVIVSGGVVDLYGTWQNKSSYRIYAKHWIAMDEGRAIIDEGDRKNFLKGGYKALGDYMIWEYTPEIGFSNSEESAKEARARLEVFRYTEQVLLFHPEREGKETGWLHMASAVPIGKEPEYGYERFRMVSDYKADEIWKRAIIHGQQGTHVTVSNDDFGVSWVGQGDVALGTPLGVGGANTGLGAGFAPQVNGTIQDFSAAREIGVLDAKSVVGNVDSAPFINKASWENRFPTAEELTPQFKLTVYNPYPQLPVDEVARGGGVLPSKGDASKGFPGHLFDGGSGGGVNNLPNKYNYWGDLSNNGNNDNEELNDNPAKISISEALKKQLESVKA